MKGYLTNSGYKGYIPSVHEYRLFDTEGEYVEYYRENEEA